MAAGIVLSIVILLFLGHLQMINRYAVDLPYHDDWAMFQDDHPAAISVAWLFDTHNMRPTPSEHIIATTKLFVWMQYHLNGWNTKVNVVLNFLIYGLFLGFIAWFSHRALPALSSYMKWAFIIFLLSPINWFNHFMATQSCYRFYLVFFFLGCCVLFSERQRWSDVLAGSILSILSIYSLSSGFGSCLVLLIAFCAFKIVRLRSKGSSVFRRNEAFQLAVAALLVGGALLFWTTQYSRPTRYPPPFLPNDLRFWGFFLNLVSFGFGIETLSSFWGIFCLLIAIVPICIIVLWRKGNLTNVEWICFAMVAGILANVAGIAILRASLGVVPKEGRYAELVLPLIPLSMISWAIVLQRHKRLQAATLAGLFVVCLVAFSNNWSFDVYRAEAVNRIEGRKCVQAYYRGLGDAHCPTVYVDSPGRFPLSTWLEPARNLNASFYRTINEELKGQ